MEFLELNHKNGGGSQQYKTYGNRLMRLIYSGLIGTEGYNVLCRVCNALDHLKRKNAKAAEAYDIRWANYTGKEAVRLDDN